MKYVRLCLLVLIILMLATPVTAIEDSVAIETLPEERVSEVKESRDIEKLTSFKHMRVHNFDVRDDHMLVVGATKGNHAYIAVYDVDGIFQYGMKMKVYGSSYVFWLDDCVALYIVRSDYVLKINENGEIIDAFKLDEALTSPTDSLFYSRERVVDNYTYQMKNNNWIVGAFPAYTKIVRIDGESTTVVYDASLNKTARILISIGAGSILFSACTYGAVNLLKDRKIRKNLKKEV